MKKTSALLVALFLVAPAFAKPVAPQPIVLASADSSASVNLQPTELTAVETQLDKQMKLAADALANKLDAQSSAKLLKSVTAKVKF
jgi:hypothetical protein